MKSTALILPLFLLSAAISPAQYTDHRGHELDSLESVVAPWTQERVASATPEEKSRISDAWNDLMWGYSDINPGRSLYFARRNLALCLQELWLNQAVQSARMIGQHHWAAGQIDSAKASFAEALAIADRMALKEPLPGKPEGYKQSTIDDAYSGVYGAIGNLYASIDSIPQAMEYYRKCGELLEKNGWTESSSVLYQNMGETWLDAGELKEAEACYEKALRYGRAAEDSLLIAKAQAGLGAICLERGRTARALQLLKAADTYFSSHEDLEFRSRIYTLDLSGKVLEAQKHQRTAIAACAILLSLLLAALVSVLFRLDRLRRQKDAADAVIGEALAAMPAGQAAGTPPELTDREAEILPLLAEGLSSKVIADRLCLTEQTIKWYRMRLLDKFQASNTAGVVSRAKELGLL